MANKQWSPREIRDMRVKDIIGKAMLGQISWLEAEKILGYSARHVRRLRSRCTASPEDDLKDKRAGRTMPHKVPEPTVREILLGIGSINVLF